MLKRYSRRYSRYYYYELAPYVCTYWPWRSALVVHQDGDIIVTNKNAVDHERDITTRRPVDSLGIPCSPEATPGEEAGSPTWVDNNYTTALCGDTRAVLNGVAGRSAPQPMDMKDSNKDTNNNSLSALLGPAGYSSTSCVATCPSCLPASVSLPHGG